MRNSVPNNIQTEILLRTKRRCCLCFGLNMDFSIKQGQIAHLDKNRNNNSPSNLAYLCLDHHDQFDLITSQSKGLSKREVLDYQNQLMDYIEIKIIENLHETNKEDYTSSELHEALKFHMGPHRTQSIVLSLSREKKTLIQLNEDIPPCDIDWTKVILNGVVYSGWVRNCPADYDKYELTLNGKRMIEVLNQLPSKLKKTAWEEVWEPWKS